MNELVPIVHLLSGGIDSTVMLYDLRNQKHPVHCLLVDYGQAHATNELSSAKKTCKKLDVMFTEFKLPTINGSTLTNGVGSNIVPNRNAILISCAVAVAINAKALMVTYACNADDAKNFPDCRPEFFNAMRNAISYAETGIELCAPYLHTTKKEICAIGNSLNVPLLETWSCYQGGIAPCGKCDACIKRQEALI
jgi:7-cyano-7-deazaguanine synthase